MKISQVRQWRRQRIYVCKLQKSNREISHAPASHRLVRYHWGGRRSRVGTKDTWSQIGPPLHPIIFVNKSFNTRTRASKRVGVWEQKTVHDRILWTNLSLRFTMLGSVNGWERNREGRIAKTTSRTVQRPAEGPS